MLMTVIVLFITKKQSTKDSEQENEKNKENVFFFLAMKLKNLCIK